MNNIYFNNAEFYLKQVPYIKGIVTVELGRELKKSLRYQRLFLISGTSYTVLDLSGKVGRIGVSPEYDEAYVIVRTKDKPSKKPVYDESDIRIIKCIIHHFSGTKPEITEKLCRELGTNILSDYHKSFGLSSLAKFKAGLFEKDPVKVGRSDVLYYGRPRYNMISLLTDFLNTPDLQIFTDPELVGKYKRISRKVEDGSTILRDRWAKFTGVAGNRTRANVSINTFSKVKVVVPENEHGVVAGERELNSVRSFALVVDGKLNMEELGIRTTNTRLIGKLKRLGIVEPMLFEGEYVIDLTKLPLFAKKQPVSPYQLGYSEWCVKISDVRFKYIDLLIYRQEKELEKLPRKIEEPEKEKTEAELYLESLGIFGDSYYPNKTKAGDVVKTYIATEVIGKVSGIPSNLYPNLRDYINTGSCKNAVIMEALKDLAGLRECTNLEDLKKARKTEETIKKNKIRKLRILKYRIISGKTLMLSGNKQLEHSTVEVKGTKIGWIVKDTEIEI